MVNYDKNTIREALSVEDVFNLLVDFGGEPEYTSFGILSSTICHNEPGVGSRKLYYYTNSGLFHCYTGCEEPSFDLFQLVMKIYEIQHHQILDLNMAVRWVAQRLGIAGAYIDEEGISSEDWTILKNYDRIQEIDVSTSTITLKDYDAAILDCFNYNVSLTPGIEENISQEVLEKAHIGYYPGGEKITIPHFDVNNRLVGLRGRALITEEADRFGKYRPLTINKLLYSHPLGMNLYGLNWAQDNIPKIGKAIVFESEKSVLKYISYFGKENNIAVACCGSNISAYQIHMLIAAGAKEIVVAFDRQFQSLGDQEHKHQITNFRKLYNKYKNYVNLSFINDKNMITGYKDSPVDCGPEKFLQLFKERVVL